MNFQDTLGALQQQMNKLETCVENKFSETLAKHSTTESELLLHDFTPCLLFETDSDNLAIPLILQVRACSRCSASATTTSSANTKLW